MTLRRSDLCVWLLAGSLLAAPLLAQSKKTTKTLTPEQQAARAKFDPKAQASPFGGSVVEDVVARVNDQIINTSDYDRAAAQLEQEGHQQGWTDQELADHKRDLLRDQIDQQLLLSKGKDLGITGETELVHRLDDIRKQNHLDSMEDLEKAASQQGVSYEDFKQNIRNGIITQQVIRDEVGRHLQMTNAELQQFYRQHASEFTQPESVRLSEILVPVAATGDEAANLAAAKAKVDDVETKIKAGDTFADLAKANSSGSTAAQGGDIGEWKRGSLAKQLEDATFALQSGQSTAPIRTKQGYVILKVTEHTAGGTQDFASVRPQVEEAAFMGRMQPALRAYLAQLRQNAYIDIRPGYTDSAAVPNSVKPLYSAYSVPAPKKKVHFKRTRYTGQNRGRHAGTATASKAASASTAGAADTTTTAAADGSTAPAGTAAADIANAGTAATTPTGTTTALASKPAPVEKPGKKEKIRYGQAPREALPPATQPPANGAEQAVGAPATDAGNDAQVASNASSSTDVPGTEAASTVERKTRFSQRARIPKDKKPKTPDQVENERVEKVSTEEQAAEQTRAAPLGLAGDTATKKKAPKVKGDKTRFSDEANKPKDAPVAAPQTSTPSPLATPGTVPTTSQNDSAPPTDNSSPADTTPAQPPATTPGAQPQP